MTEWALTVRLASHGVICCAQSSQGGAAAGSGGIVTVDASAWYEHIASLSSACLCGSAPRRVVAAALQQGVPVDVLRWIGLTGVATCRFSQVLHWR